MNIIFGGIYRRRKDDNRNDQHYYYYIPVAYTTKDGVTKYKMVDTYMVRNPCWGKATFEQKIWYLEQANCGETSAQIFFGSAEYYYQNYYTIDSLELNDNDWELVADLHDYKMISDDEAREYMDEDLLKYLPLWNEDHYRWGSGAVGSCFVKKDANKDGWKIYSKASNDYVFSFKSTYYLDLLEQTCKDVLANMKLGYGKKTEIRKTLKKIKKYRKLAKEYDEFCRNLK